MNESGLRFPEVEARSLEDREFDLPGDLEGELNLLAVAFQRRHQSDVDTWLGDFASLEEVREGLSAYEIPTLSRRWTPVRRFIDGGIASAISDQKTRSRTLTFYGDVGLVSDSLGLPDREEIAVVLCDRSGEVIWLHRGPRTDEAAASLEAALDAA